MGAPQLRRTPHLVVTMKYISPLISDARGSLGGTTFARNRSGIYTRARVAPTQPRTTSQQDNRANFAALASSWKSLAQSDIQAWNTAASAETLTDSLGNSYMPSGMQLYMSCNRNLGFIGKSPLSTPGAKPGAFPSWEGTTSTFGVHDGEPYNLFITPPTAVYDLAANAVVSMSGCISPSISFVARHLYRRIPGPYFVLTGNIFFNPTWDDIFGTRIPGTNVWLLAQLIDPLSGYAQTPTKFSFPMVEF